MAGRRHFERLTASDMFLLMWDDYGWSSDIGGLAILDGTSLLTPDGRVHVDQVRVHPVAAPGGEPELLQACEQLEERRLDPTRSLWALWLLPGLQDQRVGALLRLHHTIADGAAAAAAFGALLSLSADAPAPLAPAWTPAASPSAGELLYDNVRRRREELGRGWAGLTHPGRTGRHAREALPAWWEVLAETPSPHTNLNRPVSPRRRLAIIRKRLDTSKQVAHAHDAKANDVVPAAVAGGMRDLLAGRGEDGVGLTQRAMVTLPPPDENTGQAPGHKPAWMMVHYRT